MGRVWRWLGIGLGGAILYACFLLAFAPAHYLGRLVGWLSQEAVSIQQARGTLWQGTGTLLLRKFPSASGGRLEWSLRAWPLLLGRGVIELHYATQDADIRATLRATPGRYAVENLSAAAPAQAAALVYPPAALMSLEGRLQLTADSLEIVADDIRGTALVRWENAASRLLPVSPAGNYRLQIEGREQTVQLRLTTDQGAIQISADGEWKLVNDGMLRVAGTVATATPQPALDAMLNTFAPIQPDGRRRFSYETRLANPLTRLPR